MPDVTWTVGQIGKAAPQVKHPYIARMREAESMSAGQKDTVRRFNSMRDFIERLGLMEDKA